ncbi:MAG: hypothetical protein IPL95_13945 [Saprospiraceae bacterium]|nr:hypothetical protein [Saprospiraceae bacterium]
MYNRIANEQSTDSRTIDLPNGGTTVIVGNIIEQGPSSANSNLLGYGLEGLSNPAPHKIWICNNTFINKKSTGSFIHTQSGTDTLFVKNNILAGAKTGGLFLGSAAVVDSSNNLVSNNIADFGFVDAAKYNYQLITTSIAKDAGIEVNKSVNGYDLQTQMDV